MFNIKTIGKTVFNNNSTLYMKKSISAANVLVFEYMKLNKLHIQLSRKLTQTVRLGIYEHTLTIKYICL